MTDDDKALCEALAEAARIADLADYPEDILAINEAAARILALSAELDTVRSLARDMADALGVTRNMPVTGAAWVKMFNALTRWQEHEGKQP